MKKHLQFLFLFVFAIFISDESKAQFSYTFTAVGGAYTANSAPLTVVHGANVDDNISAAINIGFTFNYRCTNYTQFKVSSNGWLTLNTAVAGSNAWNDLNNSFDRPIIAPLWDDIATGAAGEVNYKLTGASPNRILTIEWKEMEWYYAASPWALSFQCKLYETSNNIEFIYTRNGNATFNVVSPSASIGISGTVAGEFYSLQDVTASPVVSTVTENTALATKPLSGQVYRFSPGPVCAGTPVGGTSSATPNPIVSCAAPSTTVSVTGQSSGCGITYQWQSAPAAAGPWTNVAGATSTSFTTGIAATTYFRCVITCTNSGLSANSTTTMVTTSVSPPSNDECVNAVPLTVNGNQSCGTVTAGTVSCASASAQANTCFGTDDDDVWYSFVATNTTQYIDIFYVSGSTSDMYMVLYSGTCGALSAPIFCSDPESATATGLTVGATYYIRVYTWTSTAGQSTNFNICVGSPPPPPANNNCPQAIVASVNSNSICTTVTPGWTSGSTQSMPGCVGTADDDVWFSFTALATSQDISISNQTGTFDMVHQLFSGPCGALVSLGCSDPETSSWTGLTVGAVYYVRVFTYANGAVNTGFDLCITSPCGVGGVAPNCSINYTMSTIAHNPSGYNSGTTIALSDDSHAPAFTPLGFTFCFDGVSYTDVLLCSNGYIAFPGCYTTIPGSTPTPSTYSPWVINAAIPNTTNAPRNAILGPWQDLNPGIGGNVRYTTTGAAPNRIFTVKYQNVPMFSCTTINFNGQIMLYETTNNIEVHLTDKVLCAAWNGGDAILGLHDYTGTIAVTNAAHNYPTDWAENNTAYRFTSNCAACVIPLPVTITSFDGYADGEDNRLEWTTSSELNNDYFVVERSVDALNFVEIGRIDGNGTTNTQLTYKYTDRNVQPVRVYYRIRQVDFDGKWAYSQVIIVQKANTTDVNIYPNPAKETLFMEFAIDDDKTYRYTIIYSNSLGAVAKEEVVVNKGDLTRQAKNFKSLPAGIYFVQIMNENNEVIKTQKIIKDY